MATNVQTPRASSLLLLYLPALDSCLELMGFVKGISERTPTWPAHYPRSPNVLLLFLCFRSTKQWLTRATGYQFMFKRLRPRIARGIEVAVRKADEAGEMCAVVFACAHLCLLVCTFFVLADALVRVPGASIRLRFVCQCHRK